MAALPDNELLRIVNVEFGDYREEAIAIAREELKRRNIREITDDEKAILHREVEEEKRRDKTTTAGIITSLIIYSIGKALSSILPPVITAIIIGASIGALVGMIPFFLGRKKEQHGLAKVALFVTVAAGIGFGLALAAPVSFAFVIAIFARGKQIDKKYETQIKP